MALLVSLNAESFHSVKSYQVIMLYASNIYNFWELHLNKAGINKAQTTSTKFLKSILIPFLHISGKRILHSY